MSKLLVINASPRGDASAGTQASRIFLDALQDSVEVNQLDLFGADLPEITVEITSAKMKFALGMDLTEEEASQWSAIEKLVEQFVEADSYLFCVPMWNFSIPYKMKQYVDLITHPGLTFTRGEKGPEGLASGPATVIYSRGGDYSPKDGKPDPFDFQSPYVNAWTSLVGLGPVSEVLVQTTMAGPDALAKRLEEETGRLVELAQSLA